MTGDLYGESPPLTGNPREANVVDDTPNEDLEHHIENQIELIGPILRELLAKGAESKDYWLKGRSTRILSDWIIQLQNIATLMEKQLEAAQQVIASQEKELETLRSERGKIWTPGLR